MALFYIYRITILMKRKCRNAVLTIHLENTTLWKQISLRLETWSLILVHIPVNIWRKCDGESCLRAEFCFVCKRLECNETWKKGRNMYLYSHFNLAKSSVQFCFSTVVTLLIFTSLHGTARKSITLSILVSLLLLLELAPRFNIPKLFCPKFRTLSIPLSSWGCSMTIFFWNRTAPIS